MYWMWLGDLRFINNYNISDYTWDFTDKVLENMTMQPWKHRYVVPHWYGYNSMEEKV